MAQVLHNCCCKNDQGGDPTDLDPSCVPTSRGCDEWSSGVTGGICYDEDGSGISGDTLFRYWEVEISGLTSNAMFCHESQDCDNCYYPRYTGRYDHEGDGSISCEGTPASAMNCYSYPIDYINGLYLVTREKSNQPAGSFNISTCCFDFDLWYWEYATGCEPQCKPNDCWHGNERDGNNWSHNRSRLRILLFLSNISGSGYTVPLGAKVMLVDTLGGPGSPNCGGVSNLGRTWAHNDIFRAVNATFVCDGENVFTNEITSGEKLVITDGSYAGSYRMPIYFGGTISMRPYCP